MYSQEETEVTYPEFEPLSQFDNDTDAAVYLLKLAKRYTTIADLAKKKANEILSNVNVGDIIESSDGTRVRIVSKNTTKVDTSILKTTYPEIYRELCDAGAVSISTKILKDYDLKDALISSTSRYAELCR